MNQSQRSFLIKKIQENVDNRIRLMRASKPEHPDMANYIFHAVMSNTLKIQSQEHILEAIKKKALKAKPGHNWLGDNRSWGDLEHVVKLSFSDVFILPDDYNDLLKNYHDKVAKIDEEITDLRIASESLITRIQLASDKTLQTMINEIDDMGNISLMDTKLRLISGSNQKQLE